MKNCLSKLTVLLLVSLLVGAGAGGAAFGQDHEAYWTDATDDSLLTQLDLEVGAERVIRLNAEVPPDSTLKAYNISLAYDPTKVSIESAVATTGSAFPPTNINTATGTPGEIIINSFNTSGVAGEAALPLIDVTVRGVMSGTFDFAITVNSFGSASTDQFPPTPVNLAVTVTDGGGTGQDHEAYWTDATDDSRLTQLDLEVGAERVIRLNAEVPADKTLKAYNISLAYDPAKASIVSAVATTGSALPPTNINTDTGTPGEIIINGFDTSGVAGATAIALIDVTVTGLAAGTFDFTITVNSFGSATADQFPPTPVNLAVSVTDGGGGGTGQSHEVYWTDATDDSLLTQLDLEAGAARVIRLNAGVPADKTLKAYNISLAYDPTKVFIESAVATTGSVFPPTNINTATGTPGEIIINSFSTSGVAGEATLSLIDVTVRGVMSGTFDFAITVNSFGSASEDQFPPTPVNLPVVITGSGGGTANPGAIAGTVQYPEWTTGAGTIYIGVFTDGDFNMPVPDRGAVLVDGPGDFIVEGLAPGSYYVGAFLDMEPLSLTGLPGSEDPEGEALNNPIYVEEGQTAEAGAIFLTLEDNGGPVIGEGPHAYWSDPVDGMPLGLLELPLEENRTIRLNADVPADKTLKAYKFTLAYDSANIVIESIVDTAGSAFPPGNINDQTPGTIVINGFDTTGVAGPETVSFIDVSLRGIAQGFFDFAIEVNSYGASSVDTFPLTTVNLVVNVGVVSDDEIYKEPPLALAGADFTAIAGTTVTLNGSYSQGAETYAWMTAAIPEGATATLTGGDTAKPTFAPTVAGDYTFELIVNNGTEDSPKDSVTVTIVAAGSEEAAIVALYASLTTAVQAYIAEPTEANMDAVMAHFSDSFNHDGMDKADLREEWSGTEEGLQNLLAFVAFVTEIVVDGMDADSIMTTIMMINDPWGEPFIEFEISPMPLKKEGDNWLAYGNQNAYDVWVDTIFRADGTIILEFGLESQAGDIASITVGGANIDGTLDLFDDGLHWDNEPEDDQWANRIKLDAAPTVGEVYTFTVSPVAGDPVVVTAEVTGIMDNAAGNGTVITNEFAPPTFSWDPVDGALFYAVQVFDETGAWVWGTYGIPSNFTEYQGPPLFAGQIYKWRVVSFDANENRSVSDSFDLIVEFGQEGGDKTISGTVYESDGITPIPYIWVSAWSDSAMFGFGAETNESGEYTITHLVAASDFRVDVWHENYANQFYKKADGCALPTAVEGVVDYNDCGIDPVGTSDWGQATLVDVYVNNADGIDLTMKAGVTISGTVTDGTEGIGRVWVTAWSDEVGSWGGQETKDDGTYTIGGLQEASDYRVEINDPRFAHQFYKYEGHEQDHLPPTDNDYSGLTPIGTTIWEDATLVATSEENAAKGVNFIVAEGKTISGIVLAGGQPVTDAWVNAWSESKMTGNGSPTDQNGEYEIHGLVPGDDYRVDIWSPDYTYQVYDGQTDWEQATPVDITTDDAENINFHLDAGKSISGRVADENGDGVSGIWVNAHSESTYSGGGEPTDVDGNYTITGLASAKDYRVDIWAEGYVNQFYNGKRNWEKADLVDLTEEDATGIDFTLSAGVFIEGTITLPEGSTDFSQIWVNAYSESTQMGRGEPVNKEMRMRAADNVGTFKITGLDKADDFRVDVWSEEYGYFLYKEGATNNATTDWSQATMVSTVGGSVSNIDMTLSGGFTISGTVSGLADGDHAWVNAWSESTGFGNGNEVRGTGSDVAYTIKGLQPADDYRVEIHSPKYQNQFYDGKTDWDDVDLVVITDANVAGIDFAMSTGAAISGTVTDSDGQGVADVWVDAWSPDGFWGGASTDESGNFTINGLTDSAEYHVNIHHENYASQSQKVTTGTDDAGSVVFELKAGVSISGTVSGLADGEYAWVSAWSESTGDGRGEPTDENGAYRIKGLSGAKDYRVDVWAEGYTNQFYGGKYMWDKADLVDTTGGSQDNIDFALSSGRKISGTVTVPDGGETGDIWVSAHSETTGGMGAPVEIWDGTTGTYEIMGLQPGSDYKVDFWSPNYQYVLYKEDTPEGVSDWMEASLVDISTSDATGIDMTLGAGKKISGTVTVPEGGSLQHLWVNAGSESAGSWGGSPVDETDGTYEIMGLASASDFRVDVWSESFGYQIYNKKKNWEDADLVSTVDGDASGIDFALSEGKSISGKITTTTGDAIAHAWVNINSEKNRFGRGEPTDENGDYTIRGIDAANDYKLDVWTDEYGHAMYRSEADGGGTNHTTGDWMLASELDVTDGNLTDINMSLSEGGSISGTVKDGDDNPIRDAWVNAWSAAGGNGAPTDENGEYTIKGLPSSDSYKVDVWTEDFVHTFYNQKTDWENADVVDISSGDAPGIDFTLSSGNTISGTVTAGEDPLRRIWVNAWSETAGAWGGAETDANGEYTIKGLAPANDYVVDVWSEQYAQQFYDGQTDWMDANRVDVSQGNATDVDFNLTTGSSISGTITLPNDDTNFHRVWVNAWSDEKWSGNGSPVKHDGEYKIPGLIPGAGYKMDVWSEDYVHVFYKDGTAEGTTDWEAATEIDITSESKTGVNITLGAGKSIAGTVTLDGTAKSGVWVDAWSDTTGAWGGDETDSEGAFTINGLIDGDDYVVSTWHWEYVNARSEDVSAGATDVALALSSGVSISGNLRNDAAAIGGVWVDAWSDDAGVGGWAITDGTEGSVGDFIIKGLQPNTTYTLSAMTGNHGFITVDVTVADSDVADVDMHIRTGYNISGTVTADGSAVSDKEVIVSAMQGGTFYNSTTASVTDGTYTLTNLPPGDYTVKASAGGYATTFHGGDTGTVIPIVDADLTGKNIALEASQ